jgi:hypothetical protein
MTQGIRAAGGAVAVAALMAELLLVRSNTQASPSFRFRGSTCSLRVQLWKLTQDTATAMDTFKKDMAAAYGRQDPYAGSGGTSTQPVHLSANTVKVMQDLDATLSKPPTGAIPQTWDVARAFAMVKPFGGKAAGPKQALRSVFALEFSFVTAVRAEMRVAGGGVRDYTAARTTLAATWKLLKALSCTPPPPSPTPTPTFYVRAWVTPPLVPYGAYPILNAQATAGSVCTALVRYSNGRPPPDFQGTAETARSGLTLAWSWHEALKNTRGTGVVTCQLGYETIATTAKFTVSG